MQELGLAQLDARLRGLVDAAAQARQRAYSPYSGVRVGAALLARDGTVIPGANLESASYGLTLCAERAALAAANTQGQRDFEAVAVVADGTGLAPGAILPPCGACRQLLYEAASDAGHDIVVILVSADGQRVVLSSVYELLPLAMGRHDLSSPWQG